ncbi:type 1 glutamine amidotransferase [Endothiovibrio diazotrophicus]
MIQHVPFEGPGSIARWAETGGHPIAYTHLHAGDPLPELDAFDRLVVMGGPMNIYEYDAYPWLKAEKAFLGEAVAAGKTIVGICLGAQLLADVLGGPVTPGREKEIGWLPIELTAEGKASPVSGFLPGRPTVFHWHGDTFATPPGAERLAVSEGCDNQAFLYDGRVLGLQFHLESTAESVVSIVRNCADELVPGHRFIQDADTILTEGSGHYAAINDYMAGLMDRLP